MEPPPGLPAAPADPLTLFLALVRFPSPSGREGRLADAVEEWLTSCGVACSRDGAAARTGSDTGNLIARRVVGSDRPTVLFIAHLDTVQSVDDAIEPVVGPDGVIRSVGETILGADNKSAVAALMSLLARPRMDHANVVAVFTTTEERGRMGASALEGLADVVDLAFPVDGSYPVGTVLESALGQVPFELVVRGRRTHAAKDPEQGINAVAAAAEIVVGLELGWAGDSVMNVSAVEGGSATNIVPDRAVIRGEVRAFTADPLEARLGMVRAVAARVAGRRGVHVELVECREDGAPPFPPADAAANLALAAAACAAVGVPLRRESCTATLEANFLAGMGLPTLGIASGGQAPHSTSESLAVADLERLVDLLDAVLVAAATM